MMIDGTAEAISGGRRVSPNKFIVWRPQYLLGAVLILLLAGGVYGIMNTVLSPPPPKMKQVVQQISLLPPPPPPPVEQPPQPKEEVAITEPVPVNQDAPPPGNLGLDADASGGSDGFQLQARRGGRSLLDAGGPFDWFRSRIQESIKKVLSANKTIRSANYSVNLRLWLDHDGSVKRVELVDSTGNATLDRFIERGVTEVGSIGNELPPDMPQPVVLRIGYRQ
jgi:protein TonB